MTMEPKIIQMVIIIFVYVKVSTPP
jgi:hypothetical protein